MEEEKGENSTSRRIEPPWEMAELTESSRRGEETGFVRNRARNSYSWCISWVCRENSVGNDAPQACG